MYLIRADRVFTGTRMLHRAAVLMAGAHIVAVGPADEAAAAAQTHLAATSGSAADRPELLVRDLGAVTLAPGLVDVHCHGGGGTSFAEGPEIAAALHRGRGTTTTVASLVTASLPELTFQVRSLAPLVASGVLAGLHLEGPWLAEAYKGAHPAHLLRDPDPAEVAAVLDAGVVDGVDTVRMVTLAVERPGALRTIELLRDRGIVPALGHSAATYDEARAAIDAGVRGATHLVNAMPPLHHRAPGPVPALLGDERVWCELIVDGVHVHPGLAAWIMSVSERIVLVTDAMAAAGCADGDYTLGSHDVEVRGGVARVAGTDTIAGSTLTLSAAVRHAIGAGVDPEVALRAATANPAAYLGLEGVGVLAPGSCADLVVLSADWSVSHVVQAGVGVPTV